MIDLTDEVRRSLTDLADRARPVLLGDAVIVRVRERRRRRITAAVAGIAVLVMLVPAWWARTETKPSTGTSVPVSTTPSPPTLTTHVIAAYAGSGGAWQLLDPATGLYSLAPEATSAVAISADLRTAAVLTGTGRLGIVRTTGDAETSWINLPAATAYTSVSISDDGERIAVPLWSAQVSGQTVFQRYVVAETDSLRFSVVTVQQAADSETTGLAWQGPNLLISMFTARMLNGQLAPGVASLGYAAMDPDTGKLTVLNGVGSHTGQPVYPWRHELVRGDNVVVQTDISGRPNFAISRLPTGLVFGPIQLDVPAGVKARAVGWDVIADTIIVETGAPQLKLVALRPRTGEQSELTAPIPPNATHLVLGNGNFVSPNASGMRF